MAIKLDQKGTTMPSEDYKALTLRLYAAIGAVFRTGDIALVDPLLAPDMIDHTPASGPVVGREPGKQLIASFARAFPDTTHGTSAHQQSSARHWHGYHALPRRSGCRALESIRRSRPAPAAWHCPTAGGSAALSLAGVLCILKQRVATA
jgi:hypothetical protein